LDLNKHQADRVKIVFYTDPLCCWSWALQPHWQRFIENYKQQIAYSYCMGGMIPDWKKFNDPFNSVSRPAQMGPIWMEAQHKTGAEINDLIWIKNPPASSYPACIAVKTASLQSCEASEKYLRAVWKAVMVDSMDISKKEILLEIARVLSASESINFYFDRFANEYNNELSRDAFRNDLRQIGYNKIGRFPTMTFTKAGKGLIMTGYRPYEALVEAFDQLQLICKEQVG
jgi:putative protein-disulfide isomerase